MKTTTRLILAGLFFSLLMIVGCEKEPGLIVTKLDKHVSAMPLVLDAGDNTTVTWQSNAKYTILNGLTFGPSGIRIFSGLEIDTTIVVNFYSDDPSILPVKDSVVIKVNQPLPPTEQELRERLLCLAPWKKVKLEEALTMDGPWTEIDIAFPCIQDDYLIYKKDKTALLDQGEIACEGQVKRFIPFNWTLEGSILCSDKNVLELDSTKLVISCSSFGSGGIPVFYKETYKHDY